MNMIDGLKILSENEKNVSMEEVELFQKDLSKYFRGLTNEGRLEKMGAYVALCDKLSEISDRLEAEQK